jgi:hypothetical protein
MRKMIFLLSIVAVGCCPGEPKFIRKQFDDDEVSVKWYYHSYITNTSPDIVEASLDGKVLEIYRDKELLLTDVAVHDSTIVITLAKPSEADYNFDRLDGEILSEAFGYKIVLDTSAAHGDVFKVPEGVKRCE